MILDRKTKKISHHHIYDLAKLLTKNDVLVFNETKVFPARLKGTISDKSVEILLHRQIGPNEWECLAKPGKKFSKGAIVQFPGLSAKISHINGDGSRNLTFSESDDKLMAIIEKVGETPLPPYIDKSNATAKQYQTVYAKTKGSVAAPTAGLHFTKSLLEELKKNGVHYYFITLHVGRGTFEPVKVTSIKDHHMHHEWLTLDMNTAHALNKEKQAGKRIIAIGTTTVRTLESCTSQDGKLTAYTGDTNLFITPGYRFKFVDAMITNFHLPKSTLLMLICALADRKTILNAYQEAIKHDYRFFSFGDAMLIQ